MTQNLSSFLNTHCAVVQAWVVRLDGGHLIPRSNLSTSNTVAKDGESSTGLVAEEQI